MDSLRAAFSNSLDYKLPQAQLYPISKYSHSSSSCAYTPRQAHFCNHRNKLGYKKVGKEYNLIENETQWILIAHQTMEVPLQAQIIYLKSENKQNQKNRGH